MTDISESEIDSKEFLQNVFKRDAEPPFTYRLEIPPEVSIAFLTMFLETGARTIFHKSINDLNDREMEKVKGYILSIGYDFDLDEKNKSKYVVDFSPRGERYFKEVTYKENLISFKVADFRLNNYNRCAF